MNNKLQPNWLRNSVTSGLSASVPNSEPSKNHRPTYLILRSKFRMSDNLQSDQFYWLTSNGQQ